MVRLDAQHGMVPGDIRALSGVRIELYKSVTERQDWPSMLSALPNAIARGADVVWLKEG